MIVMAGIFDLDEDYEFDEDEEFSEEDFETNEYMKSKTKAIELIGSIISPNNKDLSDINRIKKINELLDRKLLGTLKYVKLENESEMQLELSNIGKKLYEGKKYEVVKNKALVGIGGKFSAGKSKFINSILKTERLLPENQNPTTSIATYIVKGKSQKIYVYTNDNNTSEIDLEALNALTHSFYEKYKIGFTAFIDCVIIHDSNMPYKDIVFIDTPGYSKADNFDGNNSEGTISDREKAYRQLNATDYLVWLIDIENGEISVSDIEFLNSLQVKSSILVVLNKADKKPDSDIEKIIKKVELTLTNCNLNIYGVTAYSSMTGEEWNNNIISKFFDMVSMEKQSKVDVRVQLNEIEKVIDNSLTENLEETRRNSEELFDVISQSNSVMDIKSLVDLYGESLDEYSKIVLCKTRHERNVEEIERELDQHYEG